MSARKPIQNLLTPITVIHEHVNEQGMSRITIIIIWLIVIACLVAVGEVRIDNKHANKLTKHIGWCEINATRVAAWQCDDATTFNRLDWSGRPNNTT